MKEKDGHLVAGVRLYAVLRENQERDDEELREAIEYEREEEQAVGGDGAKATVEEWIP